MTDIPRGMVHFDPVAMMRPDEKTRAIAAVRQRERAWERAREAQQSQAAPQDREHVDRVIHAAMTQVDAICEIVWAREYGVERYSVIEVVSSEDTTRMQLLDFNLIHYICGERAYWEWEFSGRLLRRNETLGSRFAHVSIQSAAIRRRHLDGIWRPMVFASE